MDLPYGDLLYQINKNRLKVTTRIRIDDVKYQQRLSPLTAHIHYCLGDIQMHFIVKVYLRCKLVCVYRMASQPVQALLKQSRTLMTSFKA